MTSKEEQPATKTTAEVPKKVPEKAPEKITEKTTEVITFEIAGDKGTSADITLKFNDDLSEIGRASCRERV